MVERPASRWFGVRGELLRRNRRERAWATLKQFAANLSWIAMCEIGVEGAKHPCVVVVFRRDTGEVLTSFDWKREDEARNHVESLHQRLKQMTVDEFCVDLAIDPTNVEGPGFEDPQDLTSYWVIVDKDEWARRWGIADADRVW